MIHKHTTSVFTSFWETAKLLKVISCGFFLPFFKKKKEMSAWNVSLKLRSRNVQPLKPIILQPSTVSQKSEVGNPVREERDHRVEGKISAETETSYLVISEGPFVVVEVEVFWIPLKNGNPNMLLSSFNSCLHLTSAFETPLRPLFVSCWGPGQ